MVAGKAFAVLFYVQHLLGLGHLMRASRIAAALQMSGFQVTLVTGGVITDSLDLPGVTHIELASIAVRNGDFSQLLNSDNEPIDTDFKNNRCRQLLEAYEFARPDIVMLEAFPFGRRQMQFELLPLIERIDATTPRPLLVTSVRDVVQRRSKPGRDQQTAALIRQYIDKVLVHGDPQLSVLADSFSEAAEIADKILYTGLVLGPEPAEHSQPSDIVVSAGGGAVGYDLIRSALEAAALLPDIAAWCIVSGPNMPDEQFAQLQVICPPNVRLERFRADFTGLLYATSLSISQAGYNTVNDVMQAGCRCILIPYSAHGETEQTDRARRLKLAGIATVVEEGELSGERLATCILEVMSQAAPVSTRTQADGAYRTAEILRELITQRSCVAENIHVRGER